MSSPIPVVTRVRCRLAEVICPHCKAAQDEFGLDPRGRNDTCNNCGQTYQVAADAQIDIS